MRGSEFRYIAWCKRALRYIKLKSGIAVVIQNTFDYL